jgi:3-hydroxyacyl-CoA dehydrogenase/enoyl-CoA hydratase/3-hydroxybutyryl-CoA epimerase
VVLLDREMALADKGRSRSLDLLAKEVQRGKKTQAQADAIVARIDPTVDYAQLRGCDLVVEAVFEDAAIKADATRKAEAVIPAQAIVASNTSTLHFFSPVERMPLVEVIVGKQTSQATLANALDFVAQLRMTPIVVNDSRGFFTSRVFQTFIHEGMLLLEAGVSPALIENAAKLAGFPMGPLALLDEVTIELPWKIVQESAAALGDRFEKPAAYEVMRRMLEELQRPGKRYGKGFYEYPQGGKKRLWPGLAQAFPLARVQPTLDQVIIRLLYIQALETARCLEEGVLTHPADADVGSLLAWGFPSWTGGPLSLIETVGIRQFVATCDQLAATAGPRYLPSNALREKARLGVGFYAS